MNAAILAKLIQIVVQFLTLDIVPKGYLTQIAAGAQILTGAAMILNTALHAMQVGELPNTVTLQDAFGLVLLSNGATGTGIGRKIEALKALVNESETKTP